MKKLLTLLALTGCISAQAANWIRMDSGRGETIMSVDSSNIIWASSKRDTTNFWAKTEYRDGSYTLDRMEIHCPTRMMRIVSAYVYDSWGYQTNSYGIPTKWVNTIPGSVAESMSMYTCNYYQR